MASTTKPKAARGVSKSKAAARAAKPKATTGATQPKSSTQGSGKPSSNRKPTLLSGGNPQIPKADGDAPVQAYIDAMPEWKRDVGRRLDTLVERVVPDVRKAVRWNSPFYGVEGQGWFMSYHCITKYVKVTFLRGASLRPMPPIGSKHPQTRYFHIYEDEDFEEKRVADWIKQASKVPGDPLF